MQTAHFGEVRRHVFGNYVIYYQADEIGVCVVRVVHEAREQEPLILLTVAQLAASCAPSGPAPSSTLTLSRTRPRICALLDDLPAATLRTAATRPWASPDRF